MDFFHWTMFSLHDHGLMNVCTMVDKDNFIQRIRFDFGLGIPSGLLWLLSTNPQTGGLRSPLLRN